MYLFFADVMCRILVKSLLIGYFNNNNHFLSQSRDTILHVNLIVELKNMAGAKEVCKFARVPGGEITSYLAQKYCVKCEQNR